jgi:hypothetical protein
MPEELAAGQGHAVIVFLTGRHHFPQAGAPGYRREHAVHFIEPDRCRQVVIDTRIMVPGAVPVGARPLGAARYTSFKPGSPPPGHPRRCFLALLLPIEPITASNPKRPLLPA